jgi:uncharacterized protein (UPF0276 family)
VASIGLRAAHYQEVLSTLPPLQWVEVHSENFFGGGAARATLHAVREHYAVSLHGVGMGLASPDPLNPRHLQALQALCDEIQPAAVSEHLCWNQMSGHVVPDLLPFAYTKGALARVADKVMRVQDSLKRPLLLENLSSYVQFAESEMGEAEFLAQLVQHTGCGILLDVENLYVNSRNLGIYTTTFLQALPAKAIAQYHLAGYSERDGCLVDTHDHTVFEPVWDLFQQTLQHIGPRPTLIEWDAQLPVLAVLRGEAQQAQNYLEACHVR